MLRTRAIIFDERGRLLVQHHRSQQPDFYRLPGGGVKYEEKLEDCLIREIREEANLKINVNRLIWVRDYLEGSPYHSIEFFFLATVMGGEFTPRPEAENIELMYVDIDGLENVVFYPKDFLSKLKLIKEDREWTELNPYVRSAN
jgi:ADP-ribose pyrophosphatase YjhB (NUDIX family)